MSARTALVVGGSVGGLMAALALRSVGYATTVVERSRTGLTGFGQGIRLQPAIQDFFAEVVGRDFAPTSVRLFERRYLAASGEVAYRQPEVGFTTHWNALHSALREAYGGGIHLGSTIVDAHQDADSATIRLIDGQEFSADLVVFADGIGSVGRRLLSPDTTLDYAGYVAWRGTAPAGSLSDAHRRLLEGGLNIQVLDGAHLHLYPLPAQENGESLFNYVWYRNVAAGHDLDELLSDVEGVARTVSIPPGMVRRPIIDELISAAFRDLAPAAASVVVGSTPSVQVIFDLESSSMASGRICMLGDAAFVARPHLGAGTAKAAENALSLATALRDASDVPVALSAWQRSQLDGGRQLVRRARDLGELYQVTGTYPGDPALDALFSSASMLARAPEPAGPAAEYDDCQQPAPGPPRCPR